MKQNSNKEEEPRGKGIRMQRGKRKKMGNRASVGCALLLFGVLLIVAGALIYTYQSEQWNRQASAEGKAEQEILNWQGEAALAAGEAAAVGAAGPAGGPGDPLGGYPGAGGGCGFGQVGPGGAGTPAERAVFLVFCGGIAPYFYMKILAIFWELC